MTRNFLAKAGISVEGILSTFGPWVDVIAICVLVIVTAVVLALAVILFAPSSTPAERLVALVRAWRTGSA